MSKHADAELILKLYDLRREPVMREARNWFIREFHPQSFADIQAVAMGEKSAYMRMVVTYWDMACSLVLHGAIDEEMFNDANAEHLAVFCKIQPFIEEVRQSFGNPKAFRSLEKVVMNTPNAEERLATMRERFKAFAAAANNK